MEKILLEIVKNSILESFGEKIDWDKYNKYDFLKDKKATFVTINKNSSLRGCIGSLVAYRSLFEDLVANAKSAAFSDPRFRPLSKSELDDIEIEISILTEPKKISFKDINELKEKTINKGVILTKGNNRATFLPQVWEQLNSFELFFTHLCQKAGLNVDCYKDNIEVFVYEAIKIR